MHEPPRAGRKAKGANLIGLVKLLRLHRRTQSRASLAPELEELIDQRILVTSWYPLEQLWGLLEYAYRTLLDEKPEAAVDLGVAGGTQMWSKTHRAFLAGDDPSYSLRHMSSAWDLYLSFGSLGFVREDDSTVRFRIHGYPDVPVYHGAMIAGWHVAAAQVGGWPGARLEWVQQPWEGEGEVQQYLVRKK